jgi:hypothetical protein
MSQVLLRFSWQLKSKKSQITKSPGTDQIPAELIKAGSTVRVIRYEICTRIISVWNKDELSGDG